MRIITVVLMVLLTGCHNTNQDALIYEQRVFNSSHDLTVDAVYKRYNKKEDRYTMKQDAAPKKPKKVLFKEPIPKREPMSRYGNPTEYKVGGHQYRVMKNSSGYKARGIASWYGTKFHKQRTSSGEPYNMYVLSAAHKTLPLPTYVKVKNLDNGKVAVVKVNDRGPFHGDRVIDLSYAAALKLGIFPKGTAHVEIETLAGSSRTAQYYLQAGAFKTKALANHLRDKLAHLTTSPVFVEHYQKNYIVKVGPFAHKNRVDSLKSKLAHYGISGAFSVLV